jgi:hypothetical protein
MPAPPLTTPSNDSRRRSIDRPGANFEASFYPRVWPERQRAGLQGHVPTDGSIVLEIAAEQLDRASHLGTLLKCDLPAQNHHVSVHRRQCMFPIENDFPAVDLRLTRG